MGLMGIVNALELRPIVSLTRNEQLDILAIRNQPELRRNMYTSHEIGEDEHFRWIDQLEGSDTTQFFAVFLNDKLIGAVSLNSISRENRRADWAFYLDVSAQGGGVGAALEFKFLDFAFETLSKLNCEVIDFNDKVISLHKKFGFKEEGVRRRHIVRDGQSHDAVLLGITKEEWRESRTNLKRKAFSD